ncbi:MAG: metalloregulator ArsR/SmtB family transcription factor [Chitinophagaceae bacterium]
MEQVETDKLLFLNVKEASFYLRAINNNVRQKILKLLEERPKITVTEIFIHLRLVQSITSQHLAILRRTKIVTTIREGKHVYYELNNQRLQELHHFIKSILIESD